MGLEAGACWLPLPNFIIDFFEDIDEDISSHCPSDSCFMQCIEVVSEEASGASCKTGSCLGYKINVPYLNASNSVYACVIHDLYMRPDIAGAYSQYTTMLTHELVEDLYWMHALISKVSHLVIFSLNRNRRFLPQ